MPPFRWSELSPEPGDAAPAAGSRLIFRATKIATALLTYPAASRAAPRASPHERVHSVLRGRARYRVGREERVLEPGDGAWIAAGTSCEIEVLDAVEVVAFCDRLPPQEAAGPARAPATAFFTWEDMPADFITPKYSSARGPTLTGARIEVARMFFPAGTEGKPHKHPNEQLQVVLAGRARAAIGGAEHVLEPGGGVLFPCDVEHGAEILEDYTVLNCKDIVSGFSVYHARWER